MKSMAEKNGDEQRVMPAPAVHSEKPLAGIRIVIGEDTWHTAISLRRTIERAGASIAGMASHLAQLEAAVEMPFDAVVMDLNLNDELAIDLANRMAEQGKKVVVISGYRKPQALNDKVHAFLQKPCEPLELIDALMRPLTS